MSEKRRNYGLSTSDKFKERAQMVINQCVLLMWKTRAQQQDDHRRSNRKAGDGEGVGRDKRDGSARYLQGYLQH